MEVNFIKLLFHTMPVIFDMMFSIVIFDVLMNLKIFEEIKKLKLKKYLIVYIVSVDLTIYIRLV